jgi:hypothetical protein
MEPEKKHPEAPHDGENVTHYLGNDDYEGASLPKEKNKEDNLNGRVAKGNLGISEKESLSEKEKQEGKS